MKKKIYTACLLFFGFTAIYANTGLLRVKRAEQTSIKQDSTLYKLYREADSLYKIKDYTPAFKTAFQVLDEADKEKDFELLSKVNFLIGKIWYGSKSYENAIIYYKQGLSILNIHDIDYDSLSRKSKIEEEIDVILRIGNSFQLLYEEGIKAKISRVEEFKDSAIFYLKKVTETKSSLTMISELKSKAYNNLAGIFIRDNSLDLAEEYVLKSLEIKKRIDNKYLLASGYNTLSNLYFSKRDYANFKAAIWKGLENLEGLKGEKVSKLRADLYLNLSYSMYMTKDYRSYEYHERAWNLYDLLNRVDKEEKLAEIYSERNFEKGKQEGILQEEIEKQKAERNTWILGISSFFIIILLAFFLNQYKLRQKNLRLALSQKEAESQMEILNANLSGQEEERKRISQELHDGVLSRLFGSRMGLGYLELNSDSETQNQYQKYLEELQNIEKEIREVSHKLSSDISLSETSFLNAVSQLLNEKSKLGNFDFQLKMDDSFPWKELEGVLEMNLFRILQESLQNILKHAQAKNVFVSFKVDRKDLLVEIKDDGVGFNTKGKTKGIGLKNLKSRVKKLKGNVEISTEKENGTLIKLIIPIQKK